MADEENCITCEQDDEEQKVDEELKLDIRTVVNA